MVKQTLLQSSFFPSFYETFHKKSSLTIEGAGSFVKALLLSGLQERFALDLLILSDGNDQSKLALDLKSLGLSVHDFPISSVQVEPGDRPDLDIEGRQIEILKNLKSETHPKILLCPLQSALKLIPVYSAIHSISFKVGHKLSFESLESFIQAMGYEKGKVVTDKGQYAIRGGIVDIFPITALNPYRIEFFDDEIVLIKRFDPMSQISIEKVLEFECVSLPKKSEEKETILSYLNQNCLIIFDDPASIEDAYYNFHQLIQPQLNQSLSMEQLNEKIAGYRTLFFTEEPVEALIPMEHTPSTKKGYYQDPKIVRDIELQFFNLRFPSSIVHLPFFKLSDYYDLPDSSLEERQANLVEKLANDSSKQVILTASTPTELLSLQKFFAALDKTRIESHLHYFSEGAVFPDLNQVLISYPEFFKRTKIYRKKWRNTYHTPLSDYHELHPQDYVVHLNSGIGKFIGIEKQKNHLGQEGEFLILEYADSSRLFVPINQSHLVSRYIGAKEEKPQLHTLGTQKWAKTKIQAQKAIIGYAKDLLNLQAERELKGGFTYPEDSETYQAFEEEFPYQETEDQLKAIADIKRDMLSKKAMDRLICGDVGYGKTEVAMRAAFKAVIDGKKQVAVLVPTTILALQHHETFVSRMGSFGVKIGIVSRFQTPKQNKETLDRLKRHELDLLIGTQRLLSQDVLFSDLGLIIIDEEQRFGVRAKEKLKKIKIGVDCLTMSATPIPRTLYFSLINARDLSVINSPPHDRLPIKTILCDQDDQVITQALLRELSRHGQAYYIHNRVETIYDEATKLQKLLPGAKIQVVHGQMDSDDIDKAFHLFKLGLADILVATSIVENGIDIPNANTILIDRADQFGISDLYQLRGRVGRYNKPSFAYFMTPKFHRLQEQTQKRLRALIESSGFGGGMKLAMLDLEIRGAGDLLGTQQSGHVSTIGFHLYCKLLKKTMDALKNRRPTSFIETKIETPFPAKIPDLYLPDTSLRLEFYHRLGEAVSVKEVDQIIDELDDRFGRHPVEVDWLKVQMKLKILAGEKGFILIKYENRRLYLEKLKGEKIEKGQFLIKNPKTAKEFEEEILRFICKTI